ncbi:ABC transporter permease [Microbacterium sp. NPDC006705]|uniref:ABC transporter permease n=1 Tax=Microbacterium sp. NPDC006705 TaxID=3364181 RepID=UPI00384E4E9B
MSAESTRGDQNLVAPGASLGLLSVLARRHLLWLLVRKDVQIRYRGSVLGWVWSYLKPAAQFAVYYIAVGEFLRLNSSMPNFPIYLFSGLVLINLFNEAFGNSTRAVVDNSDLIKKIYLPRELFPVSSVIIAFVNFLPQLLVLLVVCGFVGWHPSLLQIACILLAMLIIVTLALGLGLLFGAINVGLRDAQNIVEMILLFTTWLSPVLYNISLVRGVVPDFVLVLYQLNPITGAVGLMHYGVWFPTTDQTPEVASLVGSDILLFGGLGLALSLVLLIVGQVVFRKLEKSFAQNL